MPDYTNLEIEKLRRTIATIAIWYANHSSYTQEATEQLEIVLHRVDKDFTFIDAIACIKPLTQTAGYKK
jgi:hypothetical protein